LFEKAVADPSSVPSEKINLRQLVFVQLYKVNEAKLFAGRNINSTYGKAAIITYNLALDTLFNYMNSMIDFSQQKNYKDLIDTEKWLDKSINMLNGGLVNRYKYIIKVKHYERLLNEDIRSTGLVPSTTESFIAGHGVSDEVKGEFEIPEPRIKGKESKYSDL